MRKLHSTATWEDVLATKQMIPFHIIETLGQIEEGTAITFYTYDYRLLPVAKRTYMPKIYLKATFLTGLDLSLYPGEPIWWWEAMMHMNERVTNFWISQGAKVVPSANWDADPKWDNWFFQRYEKGTIIAVSQQGAPKDAFMRGFLALCEEVKPSGIVCYGTKFTFDVDIPTVYFETYAEKKWNKERAKKWAKEAGVNPEILET